jgi:hypothetical protein
MMARQDETCDRRPSKQKRMPSPGKGLDVALVRTNVSEEHNASIIRVNRISELRTTLAITSN